jgi:N utilization substance protein A
VDWNIDVKTAQQFSEMDLSAETKRALSALFGDLEPTEEISRISELPGLNERLVDILKDNGIEYIESLISMSEKDIAGLTGVSPDDAQTISKAIAENVLVVEEEAKPAEPEGTAPQAEGSPQEAIRRPGRGSRLGRPLRPPRIAGSPPEPPLRMAAMRRRASGLRLAAWRPLRRREQRARRRAGSPPGRATPAEETYECPECGAAIRPDMTACPNCGVGLSFEEDEGQDG